MERRIRRQQQEQQGQHVVMVAGRASSPRSLNESVTNSGVSSRSMTCSLIPVRNSSLLLPAAALVGGLFAGIQVGQWIKGGGDTVVHAGAARVSYGQDEGERRSALVRGTDPGAGASGVAPREVDAGRERRRVEELTAALAEGRPLDPHLERIIAGGLLRQYLAHNEDSWDWLVSEVYLETGHPEFALELFTERPHDGDLGVRIAQALREKGDPRAAEAAAITLRMEPWRADAAGILAERDPGRAIALLREVLAGEDPQRISGTSMRLAEVLAKEGSAAEALSLINAVFERQEADASTWDLLRELDPADMERRLGTMLAANPDEAWYKEQMVSLLMQQGRGEEARVALERLLGDGTGTPEARRLLRELDPERGLAFLEGAVTRGNDADLWAELGDERLGSGNAAGAVDAWMEAFRQYPGDNDWCRKLEEHAFDQFIGEYDSIVRATENDELWGDLADTYRRQGLLDTALDCYNKASSLDPGDSEWTSKQAELKQELGLEG